jgi:hypothetical protein
MKKYKATLPNHKHLHMIALSCLIFATASRGETLKEGDKLTILRTAKGKEYHNVVIRKIEPIGLRIFHESGATLIPPEELPEYATQFASPEALKILRDKLAEQDRLWHETQGQANQEAAEVDAARQQNQIDQSAARVKEQKKEQGPDAEGSDQRISRVSMLAKTVAMGRKEHNSSYYWTGGSPMEEEFIEGSTKQVFRHRLVAIDIRNTGQTSELVLEVFWLGAASKSSGRKRGETRINSYSANIVKVPQGEKATFEVASNYRNFDSQLTYLRRDQPGSDTLKGFIVSSWGGYDYKGWIVRVSDGKGNILASQGSRPPQVAFTKDFPAPCTK